MEPKSGLKSVENEVTHPIAPVRDYQSYHFVHRKKICIFPNRTGKQSHDIGLPVSNHSFFSVVTRAFEFTESRVSARGEARRNRRRAFAPRSQLVDKPPFD
jgi:hypothetical protein